MPCPVCRAPLRPEQHAAIGSRTCPAGHGLLLQDEELRRVVGTSTIVRLHDLAEAGPRQAQACPVCLQPLHGVELQGVPARGCVVCGALWFDQGSIEHHVREVRIREHGAGSFAARDDVERIGANVQPTEVVAGLLAYYELDPSGSPSRA